MLATAIGLGQSPRGPHMTSDDKCYPLTDRRLLMVVVDLTLSPVVKGQFVPHCQWICVRPLEFLHLKGFRHLILVSSRENLLSVMAFTTLQWPTPLGVAETFVTLRSVFKDGSGIQQYLMLNAPYRWKLTLTPANIGRNFELSTRLHGSSSENWGFRVVVM